MNSVLKGGIFVALGASCYGLLTTFVKLAYAEDFTTYEVTFSQLIIGFVALSILNLFLKKKHRPIQDSKLRNKTILYLILSGTSLGFTSIFYYLAMQYITVSVGIVLLMQSVWMGVVLDGIVNKIKPTKIKIISVIIILIGTVLAADLLFHEQSADLVGIGYGFLAALSYTVTIMTSNRVGLQFHSITRSKWMMLGGLLVVSAITLPELLQGMNLEIFMIWGPILALFGTVLPPLFFTAGMPKINVGLGAIISSIELPVAVLMGYFFLSEEQNIYKWIGILLILSSIVLMNLKKVQKEPL
ncbi:EamA family transporter [Psychroflexus aestuariivivens]|uniref:EamA family transporter n=1 Tax=Psychroflexus aestuariivivens TaxID=1795040 RepID=UPI000FDC5C3E|nr:DMT family transporter [Psychroflexus aestuariivivens]